MAALQDNANMAEDSKARRTTTTATTTALIWKLTVISCWQ
jgi:hypothetical protein